MQGQGARLFDADGREYLDLRVGHRRHVARPRASRASRPCITDQASTLLHTSNLYFHPFQAEAAARLAALSGLQRTFFCNSGTEANEACLKFARRYWHTLGATGPRRLRGPRKRLRGPHDGRAVGHAGTSTTAARSSRSSGRSRSSIPRSRRRSPPRWATRRRPSSPSRSAARAASARCPTAFVRAVKDVCARTGTLLIADEVQSGLGRTGHRFYFQALGWTPDLVSVGKALGSGVPVAAALVSERVAERDLRRRSRQHLRRQPAGVPRGGVLPRAADGQGAARARARGRRALRAPAAHAGAEAPGRSSRCAAPA